MTTSVTDQLLVTIEKQRAGCELAGSALYGRVLAALGADVRAGGPSLELLAPLAGASIGDAVMLRLLAGVHRLVLDGAAPDLATHYPSAGGSPGPGLEAAFKATVARHPEVLVLALAGGVQTNEPGRSAALLCGYLRLARLGLPIRLLEVGSSAGLNLWFDQFHYRSGTWIWGPPDSPLHLDDVFVGNPPPIPESPIPESAGPAPDGPGGTGLVVVDRRGCDRDPIDVNTAPGRHRLRSFVWPDQLDRLARLDAAIEVARRRPVPIVPADAVDWLAAELAEPVADMVTVVSHSIMLQYLAKDRRRALVDTVEAAGARAGRSAPLAWLRMEPAGDRAEVRLTCWPGGMTELVARSGYHGPPVAPT